MRIFRSVTIALGNIKELALVFCLNLGVLLAPVSIATGDLCRKIGTKANKSNKKLFSKRKQPRFHFLAYCHVRRHIRISNFPWGPKHVFTANAHVRADID